MTRNLGMDDLFGHVPQQRDLPLADTPVPAASGGPVKQTVEGMRAKVEGLLQELESSATFPWTPSDLYERRGMWRFYMEWFSDPAEVEAFTQRFHAALTRFGKPLVNPPFEEAWEAGVFEKVRATVEGRAPDPRLLAPQ